MKITKHHINKTMIMRALLLVLLDLISSAVATLFAILIRYDLVIWSIPDYFWNAAISLLIVNMVFMLCCYYPFKLYKGVWRYASATELLNIILAVGAATILQVVYMFITKTHLPRSYPFFYGFAMLVMTTGIRFSYRAMKTVNLRRKIRKNGAEATKVMVIGAGAAGNEMIKEMTTTPYLNMKVCCIIDDGEQCWGKELRGVPIVGGRDSIVEMAEKYEIDEIVFAIPTAAPSQTRAILEICNQTGCKLRMLPAIYQLINGDVNVSKLREVSIEDLLGRDPVNVDIDSIMGYVSNKVVMVTGGGGSIGSELCRQIASHNPSKLVIVDIYENSTYELQQELKRTYPKLDLHVLIASVRNTKRIEDIFATYKPDIVYHAAAHKHVPLMEDSPNEAIKNNAFGTFKTAQAADKYGVKKFVLISTDKAVNPTNIMGASKRICEMVIQYMNNHSKTTFVAVRFGNVLGSNGSVIPLFKKQIEQGGPVTVTHPDIIRYFMTIPEAVSLVLQAGAFAQGGEIFVLDMGEPVKILDLAKNLIRLSGLREGEDIEIEFTGLRPGEKMYEEMLMDEEGLKDTANKMIHIGKPIEFDEKLFEEQLKKLEDLATSEAADIRVAVAEIVKTYKYEN